MSKLVAKNALILIFVEVLSKIIEFVSFVVFARVLGAEKYGLMNFVYTIATTFILIPHFGFDQLVVRDISRHKELTGKYLVGISITKVILFIMTLLLMMTWLNFFSSYPLYKKTLFYCCLGGVFFLTNIYFTSAFFRAYQRASIEAALRITMAVTVTIAGILCVILTKDLFLLFTARLVISALIFILSLYLITIWLKPDFNNALSDFKVGYYLDKGWPFAISIFFIAVYISIGVTMLNFMSGDKATGLYSVASRIMIFLFLVPAGISNAVLPAMSEKIKNDQHGFKKLTNLVVTCTLGLGILATLFNLIFGSRIIMLFLGKEYTVSGSILVLLSWSLIPGYLNYIFNSILLSFNKEKTVMSLMAIGAVFNVILNLILIPKYSYFGTASAIILTEALVVILQYTYIKLNAFPKLNIAKLNEGPFYDSLFF